MNIQFEIAQANPSDGERIIQLYRRGSGRELDLKRLMGYIESLPSAVAYAESSIVGFAFCTPFAPDIVELGNIFVDENWRSQGLGGKLLQLIESQAGGRFHSIVASNSMHYKGVAGKRPATNFYARNGYEQIWTTGMTRIFAKVVASS
jgi:GNAT superfamily N-acetyltransferase